MTNFLTDFFFHPEEVEPTLEDTKQLSKKAAFSLYKETKRSEVSSKIDGFFMDLSVFTIIAAPIALICCLAVGPFALILVPIVLLVSS